MSSPASRALSGGESLPSTRPLLLYLYFCAIAILYYDHLLTFPGEVEYVWRRPKSRSAYWFFLNRYLTFFTTLPITVFNFVQFDHDSCRKYALFRQVLLVIQVVVVDVILSLRVYAMYGLNKRILYILGVGVVVGFGITGWAISTQSNSRDLEDYSVAGCFLPLSSKSGTHLAAVWEALFAYDLLIFGIILSRSAQVRLRSRGPAASMPIISLMLRDGALYFVVMELANLTNIISFYIRRRAIHQRRALHLRNDCLGDHDLTTYAQPACARRAWLILRGSGADRSSRHEPDARHDSPGVAHICGARHRVDDVWLERAVGTVKIPGPVGACRYVGAGG